MDVLFFNIALDVNNIKNYTKIKNIMIRMKNFKDIFI